MNDQITSITQTTFGCDPEIFLLKGGQVIGAEKVIPEEGLTTLTRNPTTLACTVPRKGGIVLDGVQVELNPAPSYCRALLANEISAAFKTLKKHLATMDGITASFTQVVEVDPAELDSLSEKSKALGCAPSNNIYDQGAKIGVNPATYTKRSAGGHIHLGLTNEKVREARERLVPLLDIFVGNTCVLMDRHPGNAERRKVYGRAGEHRLPVHGLEYRTLSNFWLRGYPLFSGVLGLSRLAVNVLAHSLKIPIPFNGAYYEKAEEDILQAVDVEAVRRAINDNDVELAKKNWGVVREYLSKHTTAYGTGLHSRNLDAFDFFISKIDSDGIEYWFPDDPMEHWTTKYGQEHPARGMDGHDLGWESFLAKVDLERQGGPHATA